MKIGFIDYYLDEWHANNYPAWIREASNGEAEVAYAYGQIASPLSGITTQQWCAQYGVTPCATIAEVIEKSDVLLVLSPDNCEQHEQLCREPLSSGKRTYVDKTFAPDLATARRIFAVAQAHNTPCYSTSALRFAEEYAQVDRAAVRAINCWGPGDFETYAIHQLEPLLMLMQEPARRVQYLPGEQWYACQIEFASGRYGTISGYAEGGPFQMNVCAANGNRVLEAKSDYFRSFIAALLEFYRTGRVEVPHEETLRIMAVRTALLAAAKTPGVWCAVEEV